MLDLAVAYNRYRFLGYEFLTWLWFLIDRDPETLKKCDPELAALAIGNRMALENRGGEAVETITIRGDDAGLEEGILALRKGAVVTEMNLVYRSGDYQWRFTLKGENLDVSGLKPPETGGVEAAEDLEGAVLEKAYLYEKVLLLLDNLFKTFVELRISEGWNQDILPRLKEWIHA